MKIACERVIARPPEAVFPWIAEPEKAMQWQKNVKHGDIIVRTPQMVGTTFKETIEENGRSLDMHGEITQYAENSRIAFHLESRIHVVDVCYSVDGLNRQTRVGVQAGIRWKFPMNIVSRLLGSKMQRELAGQVDAELLDLKTICEKE
jgi:uncharacterized protein YndB with AHSA1/START domain